MEPVTRLVPSALSVTDVTGAECGSVATGADVPASQIRTPTVVAEAPAASSVLSGLNARVLIQLCPPVNRAARCAAPCRTGTSTPMYAWSNRLGACTAAENRGRAVSGVVARAPVRA